MPRRIARRVVEVATRALGVVSTILLAAIVAINGVNVAGRYLFSSPISWGEEVMLFMMIVGVFLATPAVTWDGAHIRMDLVAKALPVGIRRMLEALADFVSLAVAVLMVYVGVPIVLRLLEFDQRSDAAEIPVALPQSAIPIGFTLVAIALIARELSGKTAEDAAAMHELDA
jgi:TRAP-type C4-dicarboxylate transport system permease small subunit